MKPDLTVRERLLHYDWDVREKTVTAVLGKIELLTHAGNLMARALRDLGGRYLPDVWDELVKSADQHGG